MIEWWHIFTVLLVMYFITADYPSIPDRDDE